MKELITKDKKITIEKKELLSYIYCERERESRKSWWKKKNNDVNVCGRGENGEKKKKQKLLGNSFILNKW